MPPHLQAILRSLDDAWMGSVMATLEDSASVVLAGLAGVRGLEITSRPQGALYVMVKVRLDQLPSVTDDLAFATALMAQESVQGQPSRTPYLCSAAVLIAFATCACRLVRPALCSTSHVTACLSWAYSRLAVHSHECGCCVDRWRCYLGRCSTPPVCFASASLPHRPS